jgi:hypothetical protein
MAGHAVAAKIVADAVAARFAGEVRAASGTDAALQFRTARGKHDE